jgi:hypothetical protein
MDTLGIYLGFPLTDDTFSKTSSIILLDFLGVGKYFLSFGVRYSYSFCYEGLMGFWS